MKYLKVNNLRIEQLTCRTRDFSLNIENNIEINAGESLAVIGPNGSGKSTFIEGILGLRKTRKYKILVNDSSFQEMKKKAANRRYIGALLQGSPYQGENIKVSEIIQLHKVAYGELNNEVNISLRISELLNKKFNKLSQGQRQRVKLFLALSHEPSLIFLDEYGSALDSQQSREMLVLLKQLLKRSIICIYASHSPFDLELADSVVILKSGQVVAQGNAISLCHSYLGSHCLNIKFKCDDDFLNAIKIFKIKYDCKAILELGNNGVQVFGGRSLLDVYNDNYLHNTFYSFRLREVVKGDLLILASNWKQFDHVIAENISRV